MKNVCRALCAFLAAGLVSLSPFTVLAKGEETVISLFHHHSENCLGEVVTYAPSDGLGILVPTGEDICPLCGGVHHTYQFTSTCSCGASFYSTGHACFNSPYGSNPGGGCSNYSVMDYNTMHDHVSEELVCGYTEESEVGRIGIGISERNPAREVTLTAVYEGVLEEPSMEWSDANISDDSDEEEKPETLGSSITVVKNGVYTLTAEYEEDGEKYRLTKELTIGNIDRDGPRILEIEKSTDLPTPDKIMISVTAEDPSGLAKKAYSFNGGDFTEESSFEIEENGDYEIAVRDLPGNVSVGKFTVDNIIIPKPEPSEEEPKASEEDPKPQEVPQADIQEPLPPAVEEIAPEPEEAPTEVTPPARPTKVSPALLVKEDASEQNSEVTKIMEEVPPAEGKETKKPTPPPVPEPVFMGKPEADFGFFGFIKNLPTEVKIIAVSASSLIGVLMSAYGLILLFGSARISWMDENEKKHYLTRAFVHRSGMGYSVKIGKKALLKAKNDAFLLSLPAVFAKAHRYQPISIHLGESMYSLHVERKISLRPPV